LKLCQASPAPLQGPIVRLAISYVTRPAFFHPNTPGGPPRRHVAISALSWKFLRAPSFAVLTLSTIIARSIRLLAYTLYVSRVTVLPQPTPFHKFPLHVPLLHAEFHVPPTQLIEPSAPLIGHAGPTSDCLQQQPIACALPSRCKISICSNIGMLSLLIYNLAAPIQVRPRLPVVLEKVPASHRKQSASKDPVAPAPRHTQHRSRVRERVIFAY
jgi:hypothetical protein